MKSLIYVVILFFIVACGQIKKPDKQQLLKEINKYETAILLDTTGQLDISAINEAIKYYTLYTHHFPKDSMVPDFLFRKANLFNSLNKPNEAIVILQKIIEKYKTFSKRDICIFIIGDIYENRLQNLEKAKYYYELYLKEYPHTSLAKDIKILLDNLGKSPEEIFEQIQQKDSISTTV